MSALLALIQQKKQDIAAQRKGSTEKIGEGTTTLRIMGSWKGADEAFWHDFGKHFVKNATGQLAESYICAKKTFGKPCAICDAIAEAKGKHLPEAIAKLVDDSGAAGRVLVNAINPSHSKEPHKVHIYELPGTVFANIIDSAEQYMKMGVDLIGPTGRDLYITRTGKGMQTKYAITIAPVSTPIPEVKDLNNLDNFVAQESSEQRTRTLAALQNLAGGTAAPLGLSGGSAPGGLPAGLLAGATPMAHPALTGASPAAMTSHAVDPQAAAAAAAAHAQQQQKAQADLQAQQQILVAQQQAAALAAAQQQQVQQQQVLAAQQQQVLAAQQQQALAAQQQQQQQQAALAAQLAQQQAAAAAAMPQFEDIPDFATPALTPTPIATPDLSQSTGDPELDEMLKSLT